ncbi:MAG TPA: hypothetical protein VFX28_25050 [Methylomirabilota bacterium]|nr:hypothetical protein [Methylomirabilota bacterium]
MRGNAWRARQGLAAVVLAAAAVAGCDTFAPVSGWVKPGASASEKARDERVCQERATGAGASSARAVYENCMRERGYRLAEME